MPIQQPSRGQLHQDHASELGQDIPACHAFDAVAGLAAAALVIFEIVGHRPRDGIRPSGRGTEAGCEPLLMHPPGSSTALGLRKVENGVTVGILEVVGQTEFGFAIDPAFVAPPRDPSPAGSASAITEMQSLLDHAPVRFGTSRKTQARSARCQGCFADTACDQFGSPILPTFCLLSVPGWRRMSADTLSRNPHEI